MLLSLLKSKRLFEKQHEYVFTSKNLDSLGSLGDLIGLYFLTRMGVVSTMKQ